MDLAAAVEAAKKKGLSLPKVDKPFATPPEGTNAWQGTEDAGGGAMKAARSVEEDHQYVDPIYIVKAAAMAPLALMVLSILVLHAETKFHCVSYQIESGNAMRTYALLSEASGLRALVCVSLLRDVYEACDALHRMFWHIFFEMDEAKPGISKGRALHIVFSVTLYFAASIFEGDADALSVVETIRNVLGVQALCSFAAKNASYHSGEVRYPGQKLQHPPRRPRRRRDRLDGVVRDDQVISITQALQKLEEFWKALDAASSKAAVVSILGTSFNMCQNGAVPMLILSRCGWCTKTGWPVFAGTVCVVSRAEIMMTGMARLVVSELQRFLTYVGMIHCGSSVQKPSGVSEMQYLLDLARRFPWMCIDKLFGLRGHSNVSLGSTVCMVPLLGASAERGVLMDARVGVFQTLPLHKDKVWRAIYDLLKRAPFITGDHSIYKVMFGPEQKWKPGPGC